MTSIIKEMKLGTPETLSSYCLPIQVDNKLSGILRPITRHDINNKTEIEMLANWRNNAQEFFTTQFNVSAEGTKRWLEDILATDNRIIFIVENENQIPIGQVGLSQINQQNGTCELDNILRGDKQLFKGGMTHACSTLLNWCFKVLNIKTVNLRVLSDNNNAMSLYKKLGFNEVQRMPLTKVIESDVVRWIPVTNQTCNEVRRNIIIMQLNK